MLLDVEQTTYASLIVQLLTGVTGIHGSFIALPADHAILGTALQLETLVQMIEFVFYGWLLVSFDLQSMATVRYYDWVITTPTMLFSTMVFMKYHGLLEAGASTVFSLRDFIDLHRSDIVLLFVSNLMMLLSGYLGETGRIPQSMALLFGFAFFVLTFKIVHIYASASQVGKNVYTFLVTVLGFYGIASVFPAAEKNIALNGLDIIAKNFFGLYLYREIIRIRDDASRPSVRSA